MFNHLLYFHHNFLQLSLLNFQKFHLFARVHQTSLRYHYFKHCMFLLTCNVMSYSHLKTSPGSAQARPRLGPGSVQARSRLGPGVCCVHTTKDKLLMWTQACAELKAEPERLHKMGATSMNACWWGNIGGRESP